MKGDEDWGWKLYPLIVLGYIWLFALSIILILKIASVVLLQKGENMSWQDDVMAEQEAADALEYMGEAEWRDLYGEEVDNVK